jgi:hypothetical protein
MNKTENHEIKVIKNDGTPSLAFVSRTENTNFTFQWEEIEQQSSVDFYYTFLDNATKKWNEAIAPAQLKCCLFCHKFGFSAMAHQSTGGSKGYCHHRMETLENPQHKDIVVHIFHLCEEFKLKERK